MSPVSLKNYVTPNDRRDLMYFGLHHKAIMPESPDIAMNLITLTLLAEKFTSCTD